MYRSVVGAKGVSVPASRMAKYKTLRQQLAVGFALLPLTALDATWLWNGLPVGAVVLAVVSGWQYFVGGHAPPTTQPSGWSHARVTSSPSAPSCCSARSSTRNSAWIGEQLAADGIASLTCR